MMIIPTLWNRDLYLEREKVQDWKELKMYCTKIVNGVPETYLFSKTKTNTSGKRSKLLYYDKERNVNSSYMFQYPDEYTEIAHEKHGRQKGKSIKRFNQNGKLIKEEEPTMIGGIDITEYSYDAQNRLFQIVQNSEDDLVTETLHYQNDRLHKVVTHSESDGELTRGYIYDKQGRLEKMIRLQEEFVNLEESFFYNDAGLLVRQISESINRIHGGSNSLFVTHYKYHDNGTLASECLESLNSYESTPNSRNTDYYDLDGLLVKEHEENFLKEVDEIIKYSYEKINE